MYEIVKYINTSTNLYLLVIIFVHNVQEVKENIGRARGWGGGGEG